MDAKDVQTLGRIRLGLAAQDTTVHSTVYLHRTHQRNAKSGWEAVGMDGGADTRKAEPNVNQINHNQYTI